MFWSCRTRIYLEKLAKAARTEIPMEMCRNFLINYRKHLEAVIANKGFARKSMTYPSFIQVKIISF